MVLNQTALSFLDAIAAFMDGMVKEPESQPATVQNSQMYGKAQHGGQLSSQYYNSFG